MCAEIIARKNSDGRTQSLCSHTQNVAAISLLLSRYPNISKLIAYLHDAGKLSEAFQKYIKEGGERGSVIHAWQGAFLVNELVADSSQAALLLKEIVGFCITSHHNHLSDGIALDGSVDYYQKFNNVNGLKYFYDEIKAKITDKQKAEIQQIFDKAKREASDFLSDIKLVYKDGSSVNFALGLLVKYLYSVLIDADRLDAYLFDINEDFSDARADWNGLINTFEAEIAAYPHEKNIDKIRKSVSEKCKAAANKETGIYQLSVPTGGGKTLSSLRFALHHCKACGKKRIIYVIPYLSIVEQTANKIREILNLPDDNDIVFEHHSNIVEPEDEKSSEIRKLSASRWDSPVIITTMVQFLETVMSSRGGKLRKFASMADSVIIFDEIQSLPIKAVHCFNETVTFLSKILNSTILLCSATQPTLEATQRENLLLSENPKLIDCTEEFKSLKRVNVVPVQEMDTASAADFILRKAAENGNCLAVVNTKKSAFEIFTMLKSNINGFEVLHLSTSMYPENRNSTINTMKEHLANKTKVICVSTQLIEAGVDISFSCVVRALSGLDSIAQAAGRCNRNEEDISPKAVYTFSLKDERLEKLKDIKSGKEIADLIISNLKAGEDLLDEAVMTRFYKRYFLGKEGKMDYDTGKDGTVYSMLGCNPTGRGNYKNITGKNCPHFITQAFYTADIEFCVIENNTKSVVVMCAKTEILLDEYRKQPARIMTKDKVRIIQNLQKYSVGLYDWQIKKLSEQNAFTILDEETGIIILSKNYYSQETGVVMEAISEELII